MLSSISKIPAVLLAAVIPASARPAESTLEGKLGALDGFVWPAERARMQNPVFILERMAEDIGALRTAHPNAVFDLKSLGWREDQIRLYREAARNVCKRNCRAKYDERFRHQAEAAIIPAGDLPEAVKEAVRIFRTMSNAPGDDADIIADRLENALQRSAL